MLLASVTTAALALRASGKPFAAFAQLLHLRFLPALIALVADLAAFTKRSAHVFLLRIGFKGTHFAAVLLDAVNAKVVAAALTMVAPA